MARRIIKRSEKLRDLTDEELQSAGRKIRWEAKAGVPLATLLPEAYALVRESARRTLGIQHFEVQIMGAIALFEGHIAEMQTGEGKTLTATMPSFLRALPGYGCHVITVNDYLAKRDAELMGPIHIRLGLTVGKILENMEPDERRRNYAADITYGTSKEMGFDFLRDRLRKGASVEDGPSLRKHARSSQGSEAPVQRGHYFALIDEADSILIDEARTPLIIGLTKPNDPATVNLFRWSNRATFQLEPKQDYVYEPERRSAWLTDAGCRKIVLMSKPSLLSSMDTERIYGQVEKALTAKHAFEKDRDYVIVDNKVVIVDEGTGSRDGWAQMAGWSASGDRSQGACADHRCDRRSGADYGAEFLPAVYESLWHDGYCVAGQGRTQEDIQAEGDSNSDQPSLYPARSPLPHLQDSAGQTRSNL